LPVTAVVAGDYRQFCDWCREQGADPRSPEVLYATPTSLRGRRLVAVEYTGTWYQREDLREIEQELRLVNWHVSQHP
jgi:hypothetical protein